jgi:hypothetical protein
MPGIRGNSARRCCDGKFVGDIKLLESYIDPLHLKLLCGGQATVLVTGA